MVERLKLLHNELQGAGQGPLDSQAVGESLQALLYLNMNTSINLERL